MVNYESIYPGTNYILDPNYNFIGYRVPVSELGGTTSIQTANQLKEVNNLLNQGMKTTELSLINPEVLEMVPKEQLKEINRLNKLTGAESTMHAPTIDPSGFTQQGWDEENRKATERQFTEFVKRSHDLSPDGNIPVTIHSSLIPGSETSPIPKEMLEQYKQQIREHEGREINEEDIKELTASRMVAVDQATGQFIPLIREKLYSPISPEGRIQTPKEKLKVHNANQFINSITNLAFYKKQADEILRDAAAGAVDVLAKKQLTEEDLKKPENRDAYLKMQRADLFLDNIEKSFMGVYEQASKYGDENTKKILKEISKEWIEKSKLMQERQKENPFEVPIIKSNLIDNTINIMKQLEHSPPAVFKPVEDFAREKASETLSNVAVNTYKKFGDKSPIISIENPPYGTAISTGEELKNLIEDTRKKFTEKLSREGISKSEAQKAAEKLIGATWDTSHISMIRKQGFGPEKVVEETKKIAPYVKHVHFNDNFGSTHTDLPPGMGSLPMSEIMKELEKAKFKGKKIFEGGNFFQHFQTSPFPYTLETAGSPLYQGGPSWNQLGIPGAYYMGQGPINPPVHHSVYGAGFTTLPIELGGEMPGAQSRFSGTPNQ